MTAQTTLRPSPTRPTQPTAVDGRNNWLRRRFMSLPPWFLVAQLFMAMGWLRAATEKVIHLDWWTGEAIRTFLATSKPRTLGWYEPIVDLVLWPAAPLIALIVLAAQAAIGVSFALNRHTSAALAAALFLNLNFVALGAVNPSAFYIIIQAMMALWLIGRERTSVGLSKALRWITATGAALALINVPFIRTLDPAHVIDDPALMLITVGSLAALAGAITHLQVFGRRLP